MAKPKSNINGKKKPVEQHSTGQGRIPLNEQEKQTLVIFGSQVRTKRLNTFKRNAGNVESPRPMNQGTLATYINATGPHLSKIENGHTETGIIKLMSLAYALDTDPGDLLKEAWEYYKATKVPENK